jgi:hypothetical protein
LDFSSSNSIYEGKKGHQSKILPVADNSRRDAQTRTGFWLPAEVRDDCGNSFSILAAEDEGTADNGLEEDVVGMEDEDSGTEGQYESGTVAEQGADSGEEEGTVIEAEEVAGTEEQYETGTVAEQAADPDEQEGTGTEVEEVAGMKEQYDAGTIVREGVGTEGEDAGTEAREGAGTNDEDAGTEDGALTRKRCLSLVAGMSWAVVIFPSEVSCEACWGLHI